MPKTTTKKTTSKKSSNKQNDVEKLDRISDAMDADKEGNVEVGKEFKIGGNLHFSSLVSEKNPEGTFDPTGSGGAIAQHKVFFQNSGGKECRFFFFALSTTAPYRDNLAYEIGMDNINKWFLHGKERDFLATGYIRTNDSKIKPIVYVHMAPTNTSTYVYYLDTTTFVPQYVQLPNGQFRIGESIALTTSD